MSYFKDLSDEALVDGIIALANFRDENPLAVESNLTLMKEELLRRLKDK